LNLLYLGLWLETLLQEIKNADRSASG